MGRGGIALKTRKYLGLHHLRAWLARPSMAAWLNRLASMTAPEICGTLVSSGPMCGSSRGDSKWQPVRHADPVLSAQMLARFDRAMRRLRPRENRFFREDFDDLKDRAT